MFKFKFNFDLNVSIVCTAIFLLVGCSPVKPDLPNEIKLKRTLSEAKVSAAFGPAGLNKRFIVFELNTDTKSRLVEGGLPYIQNLPSISRKRAQIKPPKIYNAEGYTNENGVYTPPMTGPWTEPFLEWETAPLLEDARWSNKPSKNEDMALPRLDTYFGNYYEEGQAYPFVTLIPKKWLESFYEAAKNPRNFYAYGGYRANNVVLIAPDKGLLFYLYRA